MSSDNISYEAIKAAADYLLEKITQRPKIGLICGTGFGSLADDIKNSKSFDYKSIPNFPVATVEEHAGRLIFGILNDVPIICMQGRVHYFEGYPLSKCTMPIRLMKLIGVTHLIITNSAGGINPNYKVGDIMILKDHINLGNNPLVGFNDERFGPRFPAINNSYDIKLIAKAKEIAKKLDIENIVHEGVYASLSGPSFETVAEVKMLHRNGADAVGMSTVPEVIVAKHCGLNVFGISLITNICIMEYNTNDEANHLDNLNVGEIQGPILKNFISNIIASIQD